MAKLGYARVSTAEQNITTQEDALVQAGCEKIFKDHGISGDKMRRRGLDELLSYAREGDVVVVYKLDRIARSLQGLLGVIQRFKEAGIGFESLSEPGINTSSGAQGELLLNMLGAVSQFELSLIRGRVREGVKNAQQKGVKFGRPRVLNEELRADILHEVQEGASRRSVARKYNVSPGTVNNICNAELKKVPPKI